jgi:hypothetical protein
MADRFERRPWSTCIPLLFLVFQCIFAAVLFAPRRSPLTIRKDCSAARAHQVFLNLGLRHLLVVDKRNHVVRCGARVERNGGAQRHLQRYVLCSYLWPHHRQ